MPLTDLGRRVLGHLPVWHPDEASLIEEEGGPDISVRSYSLDELHARLDEDPATVTMSVEEVEKSLRALADAGLAEVASKDVEVPALDGESTETTYVEHFRMTEAGLKALTEPEGKTDQIPGEVLVELHPARAELSTEMGG